MPNQPPRRTFAPLLFLLAALIFAACGGSDDPAPAQPAPADAQPQPQQAAQQPAQQPAQQQAAPPSQPVEPLQPEQAQTQAQIQPQVQQQSQAADPAPPAETAETLDPAIRLITLFGDFTEIVYALDAGSALVGRDATSIYPDAAVDLPNLGFSGVLSAEGILALGPTLVIGNETAGPLEVLEQIEAAGVEVVIIDSPETLDAPALKIRAVGEALGLSDRAETLAQDVESRLDDIVRRSSGALPNPPAVLLLYLRGPSFQFVSGRDSAGQTLIEAAGGVDAGARAGVERFGPITPEALVAADPDVILVMERGLESVGGMDGLLEIPGVALTRAAQERRIIAMDDLFLLSFGPRLPDALAELSKRLRDLAAELADDSSKDAQ